MTAWCAGGLSTAVRARRATVSDATTPTTTSPEDRRLSAPVVTWSPMTSYAVCVRRRLHFSGVCVAVADSDAHFSNPIAVCRACVRESCNSVTRLLLTRSRHALLIRAASQRTLKDNIVYYSSAAPGCLFDDLMPFTLYSTAGLLHVVVLNVRNNAWQVR